MSPCPGSGCDAHADTLLRAPAYGRDDGQPRPREPRHVEAWMRLEHPTLDGLPRTAFTEALDAALAAALDAGPGESEALAASFGL